MKILSFRDFTNICGEVIYRLELELAPNHFLTIRTVEDNYTCDLYYCDAPRYKYPKNTVFTFDACKWGNHKGVLLNRQHKCEFDKNGNFKRSTFYISDSPEVIKKVMLKWANWYIKKNYS